MDKQKPAENNGSVRVPPKIKIKALEAVKVRIFVAAPRVCTSPFARIRHPGRYRAR